jgi:quaternary ammonium compound-resistance protein SugE
MAWIILIVAGLFEIAWVVGLKFAAGFTRFSPSLGSAIALLVSLGLLGWVVRTLPLGTAYAIWTGMGAVGTVILGIVLFRGAGYDPQSFFAQRSSWHHGRRRRIEDHFMRGFCK